MKKQLLKSALIAVAGVGLLAGSASAIPANLYDITKYDGTAKYTDGGYEFGILNHTGSTDPDSTAFLFFELAAWASTNTFGIYEFTDVGGTITVGDQLEVFAGAAAPIDSATVKFDLAAGTATVNGVTKNIDETFGWYITTTEGGGKTYYSHTALNTGDKFDHFMIFDTSDNTVSKLLGSDIVLGIEDVFGGGDKDYDDMVIGMSDVHVIPEPTTMLLFGTGLLGLAGIARRKRNK